MIHAAAYEFDEQPEEETTSERRLAPNLKMVLSSVLIEMTDFLSDGVWVKRWPAEDVKVRNQSGIRWGSDLQSLCLRDALINARANALWFTKRGGQPRRVLKSNARPGEPNPKLNPLLQKERDQPIDGTQQTGWTRF